MNGAGSSVDQPGERGQGEGRRRRKEEREEGGVAANAELGGVDQAAHDVKQANVEHASVERRDAKQVVANSQDRQKQAGDMILHY